MEMEDKLGNEIVIITLHKDMETILRDYHDSVFGDHLGIAKTYARIKKRFYWKGMKSYIAAYIGRCKQCQRNKGGRATKIPLCESDLSRNPFDKIYIAMVGPLPMSAADNKHNG